MHFDKLITELSKILISKGGDYANDDRLSNFKLAGTICGLTPQQNCLSLIATKVARLGVLYQPGKAPNNESILDSIKDLINYGILLHMLEADTKSQIAEKSSACALPPEPVMPAHTSPSSLTQ